jgi:hypothetical protein
MGACVRACMCVMVRVCAYVRARGTVCAWVDGCTCVCTVCVGVMCAAAILASSGQTWLNAKLAVAARSPAIARRSGHGNQSQKGGGACAAQERSRRTCSAHCTPVHVRAVRRQAASCALRTALCGADAPLRARAHVRRHAARGGMCSERRSTGHYAYTGRRHISMHDAAAMRTVASQRTALCVRDAPRGHRSFRAKTSAGGV